MPLIPVLKKQGGVVLGVFGQEWVDREGGKVVAVTINVVTLLVFIESFFFSILVVSAVFVQRGVLAKARLALKCLATKLLRCVHVA
eukprot:6492652-Amphidinium_carterae.3